MFEHIKTKLVGDVPTFADLEESISTHWDNILSVSVGTIEQGAEFAEERRKQDEQKKKELKKKLSVRRVTSKGTWLKSVS